MKRLAISALLAAIIALSCSFVIFKINGFFNEYGNVYANINENNYVQASEKISDIWENYETSISIFVSKDTIVHMNEYIDSIEFYSKSGNYEEFLKNCALLYSSLENILENERPDFAGLL